MAARTTNQSIRNYDSSIEVISRDKFNEMFDHARPIELLQSIRFEDLSYEYLLANYLLENSIPIKEAFLRRVEEFTWKLIVDEVNILKGEVVSGLYDYISEDLRDSEFEVASDLESFLHVIKGSPKYMWLTDPRLSVADKEHFLQNYFKES